MLLGSLYLLQYLKTILCWILIQAFRFKSGIHVHLNIQNYLGTCLGMILHVTLCSIVLRLTRLVFGLKCSSCDKHLVCEKGTNGLNKVEYWALNQSENISTLKSNMTGFIIAALFDSMLNVYILRCFTDLLYSVTKGLKRAVRLRAPDGKIRSAGARVINQSDSRILGSGGKTLDSICSLLS